MNTIIIKRYLFVVLFVFVFSYLLQSFIIPFNDNWIPLQLSTLLVAIFGITNGLSNLNMGRVIKITICCQIINHILLLSSTMPTMSGDGENYIYVVRKIAVYSNLFDGFKAFLRGISGSYYYELSDLGYVSILSTLYYVFGESLGNFMDIILKLCAHTATVYYVYKIFTRYIEHEECNDNGLVAGLVFGVSVFPAYYTFGILKESYFTFAVVLSVYWMYKLIDQISVKNLLAFVLCVFWTYTFRGIMPLYFVVAYMMYIYLKNKKAIQVQVVVLTMFFLSVVSMSFLVSILSQLETSFDARSEKYDASMVGMIMNITGPFLSPIPAINKYNVNSNLCVYSYSVINLSFAYFALLGIFNVLKNGIIKMYPILFVLLLNSIMVILTGYAINARYTYIVAPLYYSFIPFGFKYYKNIHMIVFVIGILWLTYTYNARLQ